MTGLLALFHEWGLRLHRSLSRPFKLSRPVISVGNIALGGRGKTPFVIFIAKYLKEKGWEPVVLTRGYGRHFKRSIWLLRESSVSIGAEASGDEALEIYFQSPATVLVGKNRKANAINFLKAFPSKKVVFILDDGFQHWALHRDLDIALIKNEDRKGSVFPKGYLREDFSALKRAQFVLELGKDFEKTTRLRGKVGSDKVGVLTTRAPNADYLEALHALCSQVQALTLPDHADVELMTKAMAKSGLHDFILGSKEAAKLFDNEQFKEFLSAGECRVDGFRYYFAACDLKISKPEVLFGKMDEVLRA